MGKAQVFHHRGKLPGLLCLLIVSLPLQSWGIDPGIIIAVDFIICVLFTLQHFNFLNLMQLDKFDVFIVLFLGWVFLSQLYNIIFHCDYFGLAAGTIRTSALRPVIHTLRIVFFFVFYKVLKNYLSLRPANVHKTLLCLNFVFLLLSVYGIYQAFASHLDWPLANVKIIRNPQPVASRFIFSTDPQKKIKRVFATFMEPSNYGHFLIMATFLQLGIARVYRKKRYMFTAFLLLLNLLLTYSRGSISAFTMGFLFAGIFVKWKTLFKVACLGSVVLILLLWFLKSVYAIDVSPSEFIMSNLQTYRYGHDVSSIMIVSETKRAFVIGLNNPLFGAGLGNAVMVMGQNEQIVHIRGLLPSLFADTGIPGCLFFLVFVFYHIFRSLKKRKPNCRNEYSLLSKYCGLAILTGIIQMSVAYNGGMVLVYFWFFLALDAAFVKLSLPARICEQPANKSGYHCVMPGKA